MTPADVRAMRRDEYHAFRDIMNAELERIGGNDEEASGG